LLAFEVPGIPATALPGSQVSGSQASPRRIVSLIPAVTEMLFAMSAGDQVIGVSSYDKYPPEVATRAKVGALLDPDIERILTLKPDLVVVYGTQQELSARLDRAGVPRFDYQHAGLADITVTIRRLGQRVGRADEANQLAARIERDIDAIRQQVAGRPRPKTALLFDREPGSLRGMYASAGIGFMHDMLEVAGGADAFGDLKKQSLQLSAETLLARAPEVIVEVQTTEGWPPERIARELAVWKTLPGVPAVRTGRIHILADDRLSIPGPRVAEGIRLLARVLHPSAGVDRGASSAGPGVESARRYDGYDRYGGSLEPDSCHLLWFGRRIFDGRSGAQLRFQPGR
jgi:iron complex transport system substrate-binding protein